MLSLHYEGGTIALRLEPQPGAEPELEAEEGESAWPKGLPGVRWDPRSRCYRALAFRYGELVARLRALGVPFQDRVLDLLPLELSRVQCELRPYQQEALERWLQEGGRGAVVLPTGAGKTFVALGAIARLRTATFVVGPTLDLVRQWQDVLRAHLKVPIGELTGREKRVEAVTVATYDSAYIHADKLGHRFGLVVFDEVHHLPAESYRHIAEFFAAPYRLGLTATYEREDALHELLADLLGGKVFEVPPEALRGTYLAPYTIERIFVELAPEERAAYERFQRVFQAYVRRHRLRLRSPRDFERLVLRSGFDPGAWQAVRARHRAVQLSFNAQAKLEALRGLLARHRGDRIIVFTRFNELVYRISERFFIPAITHETDRAERAEILEGFREGRYAAIVSSQVLDEGVDVPEANVGILLSGTGSPRAFVQRLGRLLRPRAGKQATLYEIVARGTGEVRTAHRRRRRRPAQVKS